jgi:hypothetical protein
MCWALGQWSRVLVHEETYIIGDSAGIPLFGGLVIKPFNYVFAALLLGSPFTSGRLLHSLLIRRRFVRPQDQWSCEFNDYVDEVKNKRVLLDHIVVCDWLRALTICDDTSPVVCNACA